MRLPSPPVCSSCKLIGISVPVGSAALPFVLRPRGSAHARLLSFFLGLGGAAFVWLANAVEGLFFVAYAATLCLWVEVEAALRPVHPAASGPDVKKQGEKKENDSSAEKESEEKTMGETYRPRADDLRIAVFFLFFVQVAFFGTGK